MRIHNLYTDASGQSHFRDIEVEWVEERRGSKLSKRLPATGIIFRETQVEHDIDWHPAPRRQYIINLDAGVKITASDGESRVIGTGEVILVEDTSGQGTCRSTSRARSGIRSSYRSSSADARRPLTAALWSMLGYVVKYWGLGQQVIGNWSEPGGGLGSVESVRSDLREANTAQEILKPSVGPERIEGRPDEDGGVESLLIGLTKPDHRLALIAEP